MMHSLIEGTIARNMQAVDKHDTWGGTVATKIDIRELIVDLVLIAHLCIRSEDPVSQSVSQSADQKE